jgi:hypothetical protein
MRPARVIGKRERDDGLADASPGLAQPNGQMVELGSPLGLADGADGTGLARRVFVRGTLYDVHGLPAYRRTIDAADQWDSLRRRHAVVQQHLEHQRNVGSAPIWRIQAALWSTASGMCGA